MRPTKRHILCVDDNDDTCSMLSVLLGRAAVELAGRACPDLILMDLNMPVLGGLAATRLLRELAGLCDVPIIAVSANAIETHRADAFAAGCNEYLTKPVDLVRLDQLLNGLLPA